ncbi:element excision factor XisH family protein [Nostoc sp. GT001]|uniref:element excision factor XisH family protein n=1 Tax=Nostoc sp. GT001 TaxID=3056647 RepID=UPI00339BB7AD
MVSHNFCRKCFRAIYQYILYYYILYYYILTRLEPDRRLYLAIRQETYSELFQEPIGKILLEKQRLCLLVFDSKREVILQWIP